MLRLTSWNENFKKGAHHKRVAVTKPTKILRISTTTLQATTIKACIYKMSVLDQFSMQHVKP